MNHNSSQFFKFSQIQRKTNFSNCNINSIHLIKLIKLKWNVIPCWKKNQIKFNQSLLNKNQQMQRENTQNTQHQTKIKNSRMRIKNKMNSINSSNNEIMRNQTKKKYHIQNKNDQKYANRMQILNSDMQYIQQILNTQKLDNIKVSQTIKNPMIMHQFNSCEIVKMEINSMLILEQKNILCVFNHNLVTQYNFIKKQKFTYQINSNQKISAIYKIKNDGFLIVSNNNNILVFQKYKKKPVLQLKSTFKILEGIIINKEEQIFFYAISQDDESINQSHELYLQILYIGKCIQGYNKAIFCQKLSELTSIKRIRKQINHLDQFIQKNICILEFQDRIVIIFQNGICFCYYFSNAQITNYSNIKMIQNKQAYYYKLANQIICFQDNNIVFYQNFRPYRFINLYIQNVGSIKQIKQRNRQKKQNNDIQSILCRNEWKLFEIRKSKYQQIQVEQIGQLDPNFNFLSFKNFHICFDHNRILQLDIDSWTIQYQYLLL